MTAQPATRPKASVFAGSDVCQAAGLPVLPGTFGPRFEDDVWDFRCVDGLTVHARRRSSVLSFHRISDPLWRTAAKEYLIALLVPHHPAVTELPHAYRVPRSVSTCHGRLHELILLFEWLPRNGIGRLSGISQHDCDAYVEYRTWSRDPAGNPLVQKPASSVWRSHTVLIDLAVYRDVLSTDRFQEGFRPWGVRTPGDVSGRSFDRANKTPPMPLEIFQPLIAAALYVAETLADHIITLNEHRKAIMHSPVGPHHSDAVTAVHGVIARHVACRTPFTEMPRGFRPEHQRAHNDPLRAVSLHAIAREAGMEHFSPAWLPKVRTVLEEAVTCVGVAPPLGRDAASVTAADGTAMPWTLPITNRDALDLTCVLRTASLLIVAALTGMRTSELRELRRGCGTVTSDATGVIRHKVRGTVVKGQPLGGRQEHWVVVPQVHHAIEILERLCTDASPEALLWESFAPDGIIATFRQWVNSPAGQRLGLGAVPGGPANLRMLRRRLAIELAHRPGGLLAAKVALKQVSVVTTEGYAATPGGAQAKLLAEIATEEEKRNLNLIGQAFADFRNGVHPAGPGARELLEFFETVDSKLTAAGPPTAITEQTIRGMLSRRAKTLHVAVANYCWFSDPGKALCLKLAGTPKAQRPLAGLCDSARCPQATHHACHRPIWAEQAKVTQVFINGLGRGQKPERQRLHAELARTEHVIAAIDAATPFGAGEAGPG